VVVAEELGKLDAKGAVGPFLTLPWRVRKFTPAD
jgi:hypothetical protein